MKKDVFIREFYENFNSIKKSPIILYGVGQYTELILKNIKGFQFVGLMDESTVGQEIYGLKVLSIEEAPACAKRIIIVSDLSVAKGIYRRIQALTKEFDMKVYYLNGLQPPAGERKVIENPYWKKNKMELMQKMKEYPIISFDIFDTLILRMCGNAQNIFKMVESECLAEGIHIDFAEYRKKAERECYDNMTHYYNFNDIYHVLRTTLSLSEQQIESLMQMELEIEERCTAVRTVMAELLNYAKKIGKTVILTSDMYLESNVIARLLARNGIQEYDKLYLSNEVKHDKYRGSIWQYIKKQFPEKKILHIGDHEISDKKTPMEEGIDVYPIFSAGKLLECSGILSLLAREDTKKEDDLLMGLFQAKAMNNPFCFHRTKGTLYIASMHQVGYLFFGPLIAVYMFWLLKKVKEEKIDTLLFVSRDGYLLKELYEYITKLTENLGGGGESILLSFVKTGVERCMY